MRRSRCTFFPPSPGVAFVLTLAVPFAASGCARKSEASVQVGSHEPAARPILQFAAEAGPGEDASATEYGDLRLGAPKTFEIKEVSVGRDNLGRPALHFEIADSQKEDFRRWTGSLVDHQLAILVDGKVLTAPTVRSALPGSGIVESGAEAWTAEEVRALVARIRAQIGGAKR